MRDTIFEGESGILNCAYAHEFRNGSVDDGWNRSLVEARFKNKSYIKGFCVDPATPVLTSDLRWISAGDVSAGMNLAGFEKDRTPFRRHYKSAIVDSAEIIFQPCYRLILDDDTEIICSEDHQWLVSGEVSGDAHWISTKRLYIGIQKQSSIIRLFDTWKTDNSYRGGYLAAAYDGEGYLTQTKDTRNGGNVNILGFTQNSNLMRELTKKFLSEINISYRESWSGGKCGEIILTNHRDIVRLLGTVRPARLLPKFKFEDLGSISIQSNGEQIANRVVAREFVGRRAVMAIKTSTETFIANGLASHNSSEKPWKLRGPQFHFAYGDEACFWADASKGTITDTTWSNLTIATRLPARPGWSDEYQTQIVIATTPRSVPLLRTSDPDPARHGIMQREDVVITRGKTTENLENLSETYRANVIAPLMGTRLGRQELEAEILDDREDALWRRDWIEETRLPPDAQIEFSRVVIAVDPAVSDGEGAAESGIVVAAADRRGHGYVLADETMRGSPDVVMRKVASLYHQYKADRVVAEVNNGGDYIGSVLRAVDANVPYRTVRASRGKAVRAEPISALYEQKRVHHIGVMPYLEDQLCSWAPSDDLSPDRLDACVWAFTDLKDLVTASWKDAYGVRSCESCKKPFFKAVDGVDRTSCPFCSVQIED